MGHGSRVRQKIAGVFLVAVAFFGSTAWAGTTGEPRRPYGAIDVIMYQTSWWPYCNKAREFLRGTGVNLIEYDVEKDLQKREEMLKKSGSRGVPVVDVEGIVIRGFHPEAYKDAIEQRRRK